MKKRLLAVLLVLCVTFILLPIPARAEVETSGSCGENARWSFDETTNTLTISGYGEMEDYKHTGESADCMTPSSPWFSENLAVEKVIIEEGITRIGDCAFASCSLLTEIEIPDTIKSIGSHAFEYCRVKSIYISRDLEEVAEGAFTRCYTIEKYTISSENTHFSVADGVLFNYDKTILVFFPSAKGPTYTFPLSVTAVKEPAFYSSQKLETVIFPDGCQEIIQHAVAGCSSLLTAVIPEGVTKIGVGAFYGCSNLKSITLPSTLQIIEDGVFHDCSSLETIDIPNSVKTIGREAFRNCTSLISATLPSGLTKIEGMLFSNCQKLESINLPSNITSIDDFAFDECHSLSSIDIPDTVRSIGYYAFGNTSIATLRLPEGLTSLANASSCKKLETVYLPESLDCLRWQPFHLNEALNDIYYAGSEKQFCACLERGACSYPYENGQLDISDTVHGSGFTRNVSVHFAKLDISFDADGGTGEMASDSVAAGSSFTLPSCGFTAPADKKFKTWQIGNQEYAPGSTYTITSDTIVTAIWVDAEKPPVSPTYAVSYAPNGGTGSMASDSVAAGSSFTLPSCGFTAPAGKEFKAWSIDGVEYAPGSACTFTGDTEVVAVWRDKTAETFVLSGAITGHKGVAYTSVTAKLVGLSGSEYQAAVEGSGSLDGNDKKECTYSVSAPAGQYNLVVEATTDQGIVVNRTLLVKLRHENQTKNVNLPNGQAKSKVTTNKSGVTAIVGGLDDLISESELADDRQVEVTLTVDSVNETSPDAENIRNAALSQTLDFVELAITKTVDGINSEITDTGSTAIEIILPFERAGKRDVRVYRSHDNKVETLTERGSADGERIEIADDTLTIFAKKFSVYAVGYTPLSASDPSSSPSSSGSVSAPASHTVDIPDTPGGTVAVNPRSASKGNTVTITAIPDDGYELASLTVTDKNGRNIELTCEGDNKYSFTMPDGKVTVNAEFSPVKPENHFTDVSEGAYYHDAVLWAVENGITAGTSATTFSPDGPCTRAQIVTFLWRAAGSPAVSGSNPFTDVSQGSYYYDAVLWAVSQGITAGTSATTFSPDTACTRAQAVTFLYRAAGSPAANGSDPFTDVASGAYYAGAVQWAVGRSITHGTSASTFSPDAGCTRAQIVTFLYRDRAGKT